jgi:predicted transcriptional regulator of viral defense system
MSSDDRSSARPGSGAGRKNEKSGRFRDMPSAARRPMLGAGRKNEKSGRFRDTAVLDSAIAVVAVPQHAVVGLDQLQELELTARAVQKRTDNGRLHRIHRSVYSLVPRSLLSRKGLYMAAVLAGGAGAALSHRSAAALLGLRKAGWTKIEVTVPTHAGRRRHQSVVVHRSTTLRPQDITVVDGIPCTTVARTLFDLAEVVDRRQVERAFDEADAMGVLDLRAIQDQLERNPTRRGAKVIRSILAEHYVGSTLTESEVEEAMLVLSRRLGLPAPEVNKWLDLDDGEPMIKPDFLWRAERLIVEVDGNHHRTRQRYESDRRRDQRALVAGWRVVRTTQTQIKRRPGELHATVAALLAQAPPGVAGSPAAVDGRAPAPRSTRRAA